MKRYILLQAFILLSGIVMADDLEINGIHYILHESDKIAEVTCYTYSGSISIPETVTYNDVEYNITKIGRGAFEDCSELTSVEMPEKLTSIGAYAFRNCTGITSISIPQSVTTIERYAFEGCNKLTSVNIKDLASWCKINFGNIYANPLIYAHRLYIDGKEATNIVIPSDIKTIPYSTFYGCSSLITVTLPPDLQSINDYAFRDCISLKSISIPNSVTEIGIGVFKGCSNLTSVTLPNNLVEIGLEAFRDCSNLTSISIPDCVHIINNFAFSGCSSLSSVHITNLAKWCDIKFSDTFSNPLSIAHHLFINGVEVTDLELADGITHIRDYTFSGCHGLKSVVIPKSVKKIGSFSFNNCCEMTSVTIPDNVQAIESCAFADCTKLTSVTIPDSITTIESAVFYGCTSLNSVIIGKKVSSIGFQAFEGCKNLNTIKILPLTPPSVNDYSFDDYNKTLLVPEESLSLYTNTDPWKNFSTIIPYNDEGTTCIK
ncbi:MAG: leucine-rich repeat domain-containing protein, partial [Prevotella sp.]|nr:leucine-rich repeat domain-containing protein [Prevotella sp.]